MSNKPKFYVSTPIYYPSAQLHIGHAYTTLLADVLNRYKKMQGYDTFFLTGSDEHGEKIEKKAKENNLDPLTFTTKMVDNFKLLWNELGIEYSKFIRTTDKYHEDAVQKIFSKLYNSQNIYKGTYEGLYCTSCEEYLSESQINKENNTCLISGNELKMLTEETYFFKMSNYSDFLLDLYKNNPDLIDPETVKSEMINNFIKPGLLDLSVTRTTFSWGIPIKEDNKHVIYVWIDALSNYITALGYMSENDEMFKKYWCDPNTEIVQLLGKEISRFHTIYWPIILHALNLRQPNKLLVHGWILYNDSKMSKSLGNVVDPLYLISKYQRDVLRFFLAYEIPYDRDGKFSYEIYLESYNTHLVNNLGNLTSRTLGMIKKYFNNQLPKCEIKHDELFQKTIKTIELFQNEMNQYHISKAIAFVVELCQNANKYIEYAKPWVLAKENEMEKLAILLSSLSYCIVVVFFLLSPVLIDSGKKILELFNIELNELDFKNINNYEIIFTKVFSDYEIVFPRVDINKELEQIMNDLVKQGSESNE